MSGSMTQNIVTGKSVLNGGSVGFWIAGNFYPKSKLNQNLELINKEKLPF